MIRDKKLVFALHKKRKLLCKISILFLVWFSSWCSPLKMQCWTNLLSLYSWHVHMFACTWLFVLHLYMWGEKDIYMWTDLSTDHTTNIIQLKSTTASNRKSVQQDDSDPWLSKKCPMMPSDRIENSVRWRSSPQPPSLLKPQHSAP